MDTTGIRILCEFAERQDRRKRKYSCTEDEDCNADYLRVVIVPPYKSKRHDEQAGNPECFRLLDNVERAIPDELWRELRRLEKGSIAANLVQKEPVEIPISLQPEVAVEIPEHESVPAEVLSLPISPTVDKSTCVNFSPEETAKIRELTRTSVVPDAIFYWSYDAHHLEDNLALKIATEQWSGIFNVPISAFAFLDEYEYSSYPHRSKLPTLAEFQQELYEHLLIPMEVYRYSPYSDMSKTSASLRNESMGRPCLPILSLIAKVICKSYLQRPPVPVGQAAAATGAVASKKHFILITDSITDPIHKCVCDALPNYMRNFSSSFLAGCSIDLQVISAPDPDPVATPSSTSATSTNDGHDIMMEEVEWDAIHRNSSSSDPCCHPLQINDEYSSIAISEPLRRDGVIACSQTPKQKRLQQRFLHHLENAATALPSSIRCSGHDLLENELASCCILTPVHHLPPDPGPGPVLGLGLHQCKKCEGSEEGRSLQSSHDHGTNTPSPPPSTACCHQVSSSRTRNVIILPSQASASASTKTDGSAAPSDSVNTNRSNYDRSCCISNLIHAATLGRMSLQQLLRKLQAIDTTTASTIRAKSRCLLWIRDVVCVHKLTQKYASLLSPREVAICAPQSAYAELQQYQKLSPPLPVPLSPLPPPLAPMSPAKQMQQHESPSSSYSATDKDKEQDTNQRADIQPTKMITLSTWSVPWLNLLPTKLIRRLQQLDMIKYRQTLSCIRTNTKQPIRKSNDNHTFHHSSVNDDGNEAKGRNGTKSIAFLRYQHQVQQGETECRVFNHLQRMLLHKGVIPSMYSAHIIQMELSTQSTMCTRREFNHPNRTEDANVPNHTHDTLPVYDCPSPSEYPPPPHSSSSSSSSNGGRGPRVTLEALLDKPSLQSVDFRSVTIGGFNVM